MRFASWDIRGVKFTPLSSHPCTDSELGLVRDEDTLFYPIHRDSKQDTKIYRKKLMCLDEKLSIRGDFNAPEA